MHKIIALNQRLGSKVNKPIHTRSSKTANKRRTGLAKRLPSNESCTPNANGVTMLLSSSRLEKLEFGVTSLIEHYGIRLYISKIFALKRHLFKDKNLSVINGSKIRAEPTKKLLSKLILSTLLRLITQIFEKVIKQQIHSTIMPNTPLPYSLILHSLDLWIL